MATIRQIVPSQQISEFRPVASEAGGGFRVLAGALEEAYNYLLPKGIAEMERRGDALGREIIQQQIGDPAGATVTKSTVSASLARTESGGRYDIVNSEGFTGKYQWGQGRLDDFNRANGTSFTLDQFKNDPGLQERAQQWHEGDIIAQLGGYEGRVVKGITMTKGAIIGAAHLGGIGGARKFIETDGAYDPADSNGTTLSDYARTHGGATVSASTSGGETFTPTMLREADGTLTARLFGPSSNPMMQAHDAAAGVAYQSDVFLKGTVDLMALSDQFALNPEGFRQAADEYVTALADAAPELFRMDVRAGLEKEVQRRFLGMVDERQRDIRQRAANSSAALADRWADDLSSAIVGGDPKEIAAARAQLSSVLAARERLPGVSWTPEQTANFIAKSEEEGARRIKTAQDEQTKTWKDALSTIVTAAKAGMHAADEAVLSNPLVQQMLPEEWRKAASFTMLRDEMPSFMAMTPAEQAQALVDMKAQPVTAAWEADLYGAAEEAAAANAKAWRDDPIKRAGEVLTANPPPPLPEFDPTNPEPFMAALGARATYGQALADQGYVEKPIYVSKAEAVTIGAMFGKDVPPEIKAAAAGAVVGAMGPAAEGFFGQISTTDPTIQHAGMLMARGGDPAVATEIMTGQSLLDQKVVQAPTATAVAKSRAGEIDTVLRSLPGVPIAQIEKAAKAIYAARVPTGADDEEQAKVMTEAWQAALGKSTVLGRTLGGIQTIGGHPTLLPPDVAGEDADKALSAAFGLRDVTASEGFGMIWPGASDPRAPDGGMWIEAAGAIPVLGGTVLDPQLFANGEIVITPVGGTRYTLSVNRNGVVQDVRAVGAEDGLAFTFDLEKLIEASRRPR